MSHEGRNVDHLVTAGFGDEWRRFDQSGVPDQVQNGIFEAYFCNFPWSRLGARAVGADFGCGSGRWAQRVAARVQRLYCVDASAEALEVARKNLQGMRNCEFIHASVGSMPLMQSSLDFGYSLGVLHHVPDTAAGLECCVRTLKPGAPFLLYLYYRFDNRPLWYRGLWWTSEGLRRLISRLPRAARYASSQVLATLLYWPLARAALAADRLGIDSRNWPLHFYAEKPFYVMRNDALDRFGTRLEKRFARAEIVRLMHAAGLGNITFNEHAPFWCAVGYRVA